jgi:hypothetical protein
MDNLELDSKSPRIHEILSQESNTLPWVPAALVVAPLALIHRSSETNSVTQGTKIRDNGIIQNPGSAGIWHPQ